MHENKLDNRIKSKEILGVRVDFGLNLGSTLEIIENKLLKDGDSHQICTTNPEFVMLCQKYPEFKTLINKSTLSVPDGSGLLLAEYYLNNLGDLNINKEKSLYWLAALMQGIKTAASFAFDRKNLGSTITGIDLLERVCQVSDTKQYSIFFLGGWPKNFLGKRVNEQIDIATLAADNIRQKYPNVNIIGSTSKFNFAEKDDGATINYVKKCMKLHNLDILDFIFVAYDQYSQQKWIDRNLNKIPARIGIGVGRTFDYLSGYATKPPYIAYKMHLSWLFSSIYQPWRIKRVLTAFPIFPLKIYLNSLNVTHE